MLLGCIADDLTGATDLTIMLTREGLRTVQTTGLPQDDLGLDDVGQWAWIRALSIGPEIDPGVPWTRSRSPLDVALALKSGNFGAPDFFLKAWSTLQ